MSFYNRDHGARDGSSIRRWVIDNSQKNNIDTKNIQIKLLCYPRIIGYVFNPINVILSLMTDDSNAISVTV